RRPRGGARRKSQVGVPPGRGRRPAAHDRPARQPGPPRAAHPAASARRRHPGAVTAAAVPASVVLVAGVALALACGLGLAALILGTAIPAMRRRSPALLERERDFAVALGVPWRAWLTMRALALGVGVLLGVVSGVWLLVPVLAIAAFVGGRFAVAGH